MNAFDVFSAASVNPIVERLGWVLVHSLWQFAAIVGLSLVIVRCLRAASANARYGLLSFAMATMVLCPIVTWYVLVPEVVGDREFSKTSETPRLEISAEPARVPQIASREKFEKPIEERDVATALAPNLISPMIIEQQQTNRPLLSELRSAVRPWLAWIVALWSLGVIVCAMRPTLSWIAIRRLRRVGTLSVNNELLEVMRRVCKQFGVIRPVQLFQSTLVQVPVVLGYLQPMILLPVCLLNNLPLSQLEAILAHELAHVRRHDFLVNLMQTIVESLFFYHPGVWWLSRRIRIEREHCCDDLVIRVLGNRVEYGRALVAIEQLRGDSGVLALGAADGSMLARIRRIVALSGNNYPPSRWSPWNILATTTAIFAMSGLLCWQGLAQTASKPTAESKPEQTQAEKPVNHDLQFSEELQIKLTRQDAREGSWYFIDLEKGELKKPPFAVDIDATRLPYFVNKPSEKDLNEWLVREGVDLIVRSSIDQIFTEEFFKRVDRSSEGKQVPEGKIKRNDIQVRSVRTLMRDLPYSLKQNADKSWAWTTTPQDVVKVFARKDDAVHVSGFVPNSFAGDIRPDSPILRPFRTANNVLGLFLLEQPSATEDELTLRIVYVKNSDSPMADLRFGPDELVSGKIGASSTAADERSESPFIAKFPNDVRVEFAGITKGVGDIKAAERWWKPDGTQLGLAPEYRGGSGGSEEADKENPYVRTVIHVHGIADESAVTATAAIQTAESKVDESSGRYVAHYGYTDAPEATRSFEVGVATEPLSLVRWLDRNGKRRPNEGELTDDSDKLDPIAEDITIEKNGPETWGRHAAGYGPMIDPIGPNDEQGGRKTGTTQVTIRVPLKWRQVDLRLFAIDKAGKSHGADTTVRLEPNEENADYTRLAKILPISFDEVDHFEYQFRLYRHWVTFENVSLRKGAQTNVNVKMETIPQMPQSKIAEQNEPNAIVALGNRPNAPSLLFADFLNTRSVGFSEDNQRLVSVATKEDVTVRTWNIAEQKLISEVKLDRAVDGAAALHGNQFLMSGLKLSKDLKRLVGCVQNKVRIWSAEDGKLIQTLPNPVRDGRGVGPRGLASTPNFETIAAAIGADGFRSNNAACEVAIWQGEEYGRIKRLSHPAAVQITSLALSSDGSRLASGSQTASTCVFDLVAGKLLYTLPNSNGDRKHPDPEVTETGANQVLCLAFSPDGKKLAIGDLLGIKIVDASNGELIHAIESPFRFGMSGLLFSANGKLLARTATDKTVPIWSTETGKLITELPTEAHDAAFSSDGAWFATGFSDDKNALSLWKFSAEPQKATTNVPHSQNSDVEKTVLGILRTPFIEDPSGGSWQSGAQEIQVLSKLRLVPQRIEVIKTLLKVVDRTEQSTMDERRLAMLYLSGADPKNLVPLLEKAIQVANSDPSNSFTAYHEIEILGRIGEDARRAMPLLIKLLDSKDRLAYDMAVDALVKIGARSPEVMNELAKHTDDPLTVYQLGRYGQMAKPLGPQFVKLLDSPSNEIRTWAAQALVKSGFDEARGFDVLIADVTAGKSANRSLAATALAALGSQATSIIPKLRPFENDTDSLVAKAVKEAIVRIEKDDRIFTHAEEATKRDAARETASKLNPKMQFNLRFLGGDERVPLDGIEIYATEGYGDTQKKFGPFKTNASGTANCELPQGFYTLHLHSNKEVPYLPWEKHWNEVAPPGHHYLNLNVTGTDVEKWLGGNRQDRGVELAKTPNELTRITFTLLDPIELVLRAIDAETGRGLAGATFYFESAVAEDWAHPIDGANIGAGSYPDGQNKFDGVEYHTDTDGYFRRFISDSDLRESRDGEWGPKYGVWKSPPDYEVVEPRGEVDIEVPVGKRTVEHVFKFRSVKKNLTVVGPDQSAVKPRVERLVINKDGEIWLEGMKVSLDELREKASTIEKKSFQIEADKDVAYNKVIEVLDVLKAAGVTEFSFIDARLGNGKYRVANQQASYKFDDKHGFSMCRPTGYPHFFTVLWHADGDRPKCTLRTYPNISDLASSKWAVAWEPGTDVLWWVDDTDIGKMNLKDPASVIINRESRLSESFSREFGLPDEVKTEFRRLGFVIGLNEPTDEKISVRGVTGEGHQTIVSAECWQWIVEGTVNDVDGQPLKDVTIRVSSNEEIKTVMTDKNGKYNAFFSLSLQQLAKWRGVKVEPILEGYVERDMAKSGEFNALLYAGEQPQRVRIAGEIDFKAGAIPRFAEKDIVQLPQNGANSGTADFVMLKVGDK